MLCPIWVIYETIFKLAKNKCSICGATPVRGWGWCSVHYQRWLRKGDPLWVREKVIKAKCSVYGCDRIEYSHSICTMHLKRQHRHGSPTYTRPSTKGKKIIDPSGYVRINIGGKYEREHRVVMSSILGRSLEPWESVHHINGNKQDNEIKNLQLRTGKHGKGIVHVCCDCGSKNTMAVPLA